MCEFDRSQGIPSCQAGTVQHSALGGAVNSETLTSTIRCVRAYLAVVVYEARQEDLSCRVANIRAVSAAAGGGRVDYDGGGEKPEGGAHHRFARSFARARGVVVVARARTQDGRRP